MIRDLGVSQTGNFDTDVATYITCDQTGGYTVKDPHDIRSAETRPFANDKTFHCCPDRGEESGDPLPRRDIQKP